MDREAFEKMDAYMTLSIINMKLRDEFSTLEDFSSYYNIDKEDVLNKFKNIGYCYDVNLNQFKANI